MKIKCIKAREIIDSRGNPTIEVDIKLDSGAFGRAAVPSGSSVGSKEALELRDGGSRYKGKGVLGAVANVRKIANMLLGRQFNSQNEFDNMLIQIDGTDNKSNMGANTLLALSLAFAKAHAASINKQLFENIGGTIKTLPRAMMNIINGGAHADNELDIQEFMIIPLKYENFADSIRMGAEVFHTLKKRLSDMNCNTNVGDEGGFAPSVKSADSCLDIIISAIEAAGYTPAEDIALGLDVAASEFYEDGVYMMEGKKHSSDELIRYFERLCAKYPIISIEDPMSEFDEEGWVNITSSLGDGIQIVGDDVFVTNPEIFKSGINKGIANAILIKPNQIGTLTETLNTIDIAVKNDYATIISHRSGETEDTTIAHIAVGTCAGQIKTGSLSRTDRVAKYNELIRIEENLLKN